MATITTVDSNIPRTDIYDVRRGDDVTIRVTLNANGDISGWSFAAAVRYDRGEADSVSETLTPTPSINDNGGASSAGVVDIPLTDTETLTLTANHDYWWSLKRNDAGSEYTIAEGKLVPKNTAAR